MYIKRVVSVYFSPTGTTGKVAEHIANNVSKKLSVVMEINNFTLPKERKNKLEFQKGDLIILGTPVYAGRVPNVILPYITKYILAKGALAVPIVVYGNRNYDDALIELRDILEQNGFHTIAAAAFVGEHSFSDTLAANRPDESDMYYAKLFAFDISKRIKNLLKVPDTPIKVKGQTPIRTYYTPRDRNGMHINILKVKSKVNESCTKCGICAKVCPMGSIDEKDVTKYTNICIKCGACTKKCPHQSRYYDDEGYLYHLKELEEGYTFRRKPELF